MLISRKLYLCRKNLGLSQGSMASNVISTATLSRIESKSAEVFADDLIEILKVNQISVIDFLTEYSTSEMPVGYYQEQAMYYFANGKLESLCELYEGLRVNSKLLKLLMREMIRSLAGEKLQEEKEVKRLLFKLNEYDDNFLWYLEVSLALYNKNNFSVLLEKIFLKFEDQCLPATTEKLLADIVITLLRDESSTCSDVLKKEGLDLLLSFGATPGIFLQKLAGRYLLAKHQKNSREMLLISYQVAGINLKEEFIQLVNC